MNRTEIINTLISKNGYKKYLEVGLDNPDSNFNKIHCDMKESVDPFPTGGYWGYRRIPTELTYKMTSDELFASTDNVYDIVFIDGLHRDYQVYRDFVNAYNHLSVNGIILMHDCKPRLKELAQAEPTNWTGEWYGTTWKSIPALLEKNNVKVEVINTDCGIGIFKKVSDDKLELMQLDEEYFNKFEYEKYDELVTVINENELEKYFN